MRRQKRKEQCGYERMDAQAPAAGPAGSTHGALPAAAHAQRPSGGRLFAVAPNFAVDCLETLYDIAVELRDAWQAAARASGAPEGSEATRLHYIPCLNDSDAQVRLLRSLIAEA